MRQGHGKSESSKERLVNLIHKTDCGLLLLLLLTSFLLNEWKFHILLVSSHPSPPLLMYIDYHCCRETSHRESEDESASDSSAPNAGRRSTSEGEKDRRRRGNEMKGKERREAGVEKKQASDPHPEYEGRVSLFLRRPTLFSLLSLLSTFSSSMMRQPAAKHFDRTHYLLT